MLSGRGLQVLAADSAHNDNDGQEHLHDEGEAATAAGASGRFARANGAVVALGGGRCAGALGFNTFGGSAAAVDGANEVGAHIVAGGFGVANILKVIGSVLSGGIEEELATAGMVVKEVGDVVHVAIDHKPAGRLRRVLRRFLL